MAVPKQKNHRATRARSSGRDGRGRGTTTSTENLAGGIAATSSQAKTDVSLRTALEYLREGDVFVVHSIDRLAQNIEDLRKAVLALSGRGVLVEFINQLLTTSAEDQEASRLLVKAIGAVAEFQHALIKEQEGEALSSPERSNAPVGRKGRKRALTPDRVIELQKRAAAGEKKAVLAREFGISRETLYQYLAAI